MSLETLDIPDEGLSVHLRGYGWVTVFKFLAKNGRIDYVSTNMENPTREGVQKIMEARWSIEVYHRELKKTCGMELSCAHLSNPVFLEELSEEFYCQA